MITHFLRKKKTSVIVTLASFGCLRCYDRYTKQPNPIALCALHKQPFQSISSYRKKNEKNIFPTSRFYLTILCTKPLVHHKQTA